MASITLDERDLLTRANDLHTVFAPLRKGRKRLAIRRANSAGGTVALAASDLAVGWLSYRDASFRTSVETLRGRYFELWRTVGRTKLLLDRAYFTLERIQQASHTFDEILCVHTDPGDIEEYKQGPHLHVTCAEQPIPHCHFPLDLGSLHTVLKDCASLTTAMQRAIRVVATDVLPKFR
jgi:hypothetical protein